MGFLNFSDDDIDKADLVMQDILERQEFVPEKMITLRNEFANGLLQGWRESQIESSTVVRQLIAGLFEEFVSTDIDHILLHIARFGKGIGTIIGALKYSVLNVLSDAKAVESYARFINKLKNERPEFYVVVIDVTRRWKTKIIKSHLHLLNSEQNANYKIFISKIGI